MAVRPGGSPLGGAANLGLHALPNFQCTYLFRLCHLAFVTREEQWDKTVRFFVRGLRSYQDWKWCTIGIVRRNTRWALAGDVLIAPWRTGDCRSGYHGITSKGRRLCSYWFTEFPCLKSGSIEPFVLPAELRELPVSAPAVRAFVLEKLTCEPRPLRDSTPACPGR